MGKGRLECMSQCSHIIQYIVQYYIGADTEKYLEHFSQSLLYATIPVSYARQMQRNREAPPTKPLVKHEST
jgi:hypothetical protein